MACYNYIDTILLITIVLSFPVGIPTISDPEYRDLIGISHESGLGLIICKTSGFPPTSVVWKKDNSSVSGNSSAYLAMQTVVNRATSSYSNTLMHLEY